MTLSDVFAPFRSRRNEDAPVGADERVTVAAVLEGTRLLWKNVVMRYALLLKLKAAARRIVRDEQAELRQYQRWQKINNRK